MTSQIVIGVPGLWKSRSDIVRSIAERTLGENGKGYIFAGAILLDTATQTGYMLEIYGPDPQLARAFEIAGQGLLTQTDLERIAQHSFTLYVVKEDPSLDTAKAVLRAGSALLKAGGIGVKVESAGIAFPGHHWAEVTASCDLSEIYRTFVTLVIGESHFYSCGMQNFGLPDSAIPRSVDAATAANTLNRFNFYELAENPSLEDGHTFSLDAESPRYRLNKQKYEGYNASSPLYNSFGCWVLSEVN